ncbi:uncharacterized protein LOC115703869 [Cannabis sativa]|uniref:uncharacterized protein LOC115703869 n=1 Tax=Cannabis sativa TaxID=3483 RepID=UPI0029CA3E11|nr:uncharacterized protein LOC115703869 [Cannabis sativa]
MQNKIATLWQPGRGLYVKELDSNLFLFQFYHEVDIERVIEGSPWTFDRAPLIFERVKSGENPRSIPLLFEVPREQIVQEYNLDLKAAPRRRNYADGSRWLKSGLAVKSNTEKPPEASSFNGGGRSHQIPPFRENQRGRITMNQVASLIHQDLRSRNDSPSIKIVDHSNEAQITMEKSLSLRKDNTTGMMAPTQSDLNSGLVFIDNKRRRMGHTNEVGLNETQEIEVGRGGTNNDQDVNNMDISQPETNVDTVQNDASKNFLEAGAGVFVVDAIGASGGIALLWKNQDDGTLLGYSNNHIDLQISISPSTPSWRLTGFYGEPNRNRRSDSWALLQSLRDRSSLPLCVIGDINNIICQEDKRGGRPYPQWLLTGFQQTLLHCGLEDLELQGHHHRFRFENSWLKEPLCLEIVRDAWSEEQNGNISNKIKLCVERLLSWGKELTGNLNQRIKAYKNDLQKLHGLRDINSVQRYDEIKKKLYEALDRRESYWKQRAKQFWLREGDQNSSYFHKAASRRKKNNQITQLRDNNGNWVSWDSGLTTVVADYFNELFTASGSVCTEVVDCVPSSVPNFVNMELCQPIEDEEVRKAVFQMHPDKSPGPDGMTPAFFQKCWPIVGNEVVKNVLCFFEEGILADSCGDANVVLIPKTRNPERMSDLRPIALCNVLFKIITKVMVNRMKPFMDSIISENQSAFIPGRLISDNILVSFEILHYLKRKRKGKEGFMALKLDMSKAYDRIEWDFLEAMLRKLGYVERWVQLVMMCVKSAKYCVMHNNNEVGPIIPTRGFTALLRKYEQRGWLHGCKVANGAPRVSHMLFADDSYLYCKATEMEARRIQEVLSKFELASGQKVNFSKSSIFYSANTLDTMKVRVNALLGMTTAIEGSLYLGLPSSMGRNKSAALGFLKNKVKNRLSGYGTKFLSRAGKEILIKTVAQALPSYAMSVFLIPQEVTRDIEGLMSKFWWQSSNNSPKGIHWMSWKKLCKHKSKGGMGFRNLRSFNLALLGKQGWRLITKPETLVSRIFKARYYPRFFTADIGNNPSYVWHSVLEARQFLSHGVCWSIGNGNSISILGEPWLPDTQNPFITSSHPTLIGAKVCNLFSTDGVGWDEEIVADLFVQRDQDLLLDIPLLRGQDRDNITWKGEISGLYTVRSAYKIVQEINGEEDQGSAAVEQFWKKFWALKLPLKMKNLAWRACQGCLPTMIQLRTKRVEVSSVCPDSQEESIFHALVGCPAAALCWNRVGIGTAAPQQNNFFDWCALKFLVCDADQKKLMVALCWSIWNARNDKVWNNKTSSVKSIVFSAQSYLNQWLTAHSSNVIFPSPGLILGDGAEQWQPPHEDSIKVNVDAALFSNTTQFGIGFVIRNAQGVLIEGVTKLFNGSATPELVEAMSVKEALSWIKRNQLCQAILETDCLVFIQALRSSIEMISMFGQVVKDCKVLLKELKSVSIFFIRRSANKVAHSFARASLFYPDCNFNMGSVPIDLLPFLVAEVID